MAYRVVLLITPQLSPLITLFYQLNGMFSLLGSLLLCYSKCGLRSAALVLPGSWLEMQNLGSHRKPRESKSAF